MPAAFSVKPRWWQDLSSWRIGTKFSINQSNHAVNKWCNGKNQEFLNRVGKLHTNF